jgi:hypothetical protein
MFSQRKQINTETIGTTKKLIRQFLKPATVFCLVFVHWNFFNSINAHNTHSWEPFFDQYEKGECKKLLQRLEYLNKPKAWTNNGLWSRSRIIKSKCHLEFGSYKEALESIRLRPESKIKDAWLFQKIRILLKASRHQEAIAEIRNLLKHPKMKYYLVSLREELKKSFQKNKEIYFIFHLLHDTRKNKNWFRKDYKLHSIYMKGAKLHGAK